MEIDKASLALEYGLAVNSGGGLPVLDAIGEGPLTMLNLFALEEEATYPDGTACTGLEAMLRYGATSGERLAAVGGAFITQALPTGVVWGEDADWDLLVVATYPSALAFWQLLADPLYREAFVHRRAAVARQRVTVGVPLS